MNLNQVKRVVARITPPMARSVDAFKNRHGMVYIQVTGYVRDLTDPLHPGSYGWQKGRKAYVSEFSCESEIFQACLELFIAFETHEIREAFLVDGKRVFGPHISTNALAEVCERIDVREES